MDRVKVFLLPVFIAIVLILFAVSPVPAERGPMTPVAPMMIEHRLIEKILPVIDAVKGEMERTGKVDTAAVAAIVDFFRTYGDEVHHGKEEAIYFHELAKKKIPPAERSLMEELIREHQQARGIIGELAGALDRYEKGDPAARKDIENALGKLPGLYREHIRKEDKVLFLPSLDAFSRAEQQELLQRMRAYDGKMIHEKYRREVMGLRVKYP